MTMFLKQKIRNLHKDLLYRQKGLIKAIGRYNSLVAEFQNQNNFTPIQLSPQQEPSPPKESYNETEPTIPMATSTSVKTPKGVWSPEKKKAFGEKMKKAREDKLAKLAKNMEA